MRVVVYTALFGDIDKLWSILPTATGDCLHVCFSDRERTQVGLWGEGNKIVSSQQVITPRWEVRIPDLLYDHRKAARYVKAMPHVLMPDADIWIWVDANVRLRIRPQRAISAWLKHGLAAFNHPDRGCLYQEGDFCAKMHKAPKPLVHKQLEQYRKVGMPKGWGLAETRCVIRRNTGRVQELNELWWEQMDRYTVRDQISLPFVCWKLGIRWDVIPGRVWVKSTNRGFWFTKHRS